MIGVSIVWSVKPDIQVTSDDDWLQLIHLIVEYVQQFREKKRYLFDPGR